MQHGVVDYAEGYSLEDLLRAKKLGGRKWLGTRQKIGSIVDGFGI